MGMSHNGILDDRDLEACVRLTCAVVRSINAHSHTLYLP